MPSDLRLRLRRYSSAGVRGAVIDYSSLGVSMPASDAFAITNCLVSSRAYAALSFPMLAGLEWSTGEPDDTVPGGLYFLTTDSYDAADTSKVHTVTGVQYIPMMLGGAKMYPSEAAMLAEGGGDRRSLSGTPGAIIRSLLLEAQARGWFPDLTLGFSDTLDSAGVAWSTSVPSFTVTIGHSVWSLLSSLVKMGVCEFTADYAGGVHVLDLWNPGHGTDWSVPTPTGETLTNFSTNPSFETVAAGSTILRTNRAINARAAVDLTGWTGLGEVTRTRMTGSGLSFADTFVRSTWTVGTTSPQTVELGSSAATRAPLPPNTIYRAAMYVRPSISRVAYIDVMEIDSSNGQVYDGGQTTVTLDAGVWTRIETPLATSTPTTASGRVRVVLNNGVPTGETIDVTAVIVETSSTLGDYFDGSTPDALGWDYGWSGTANASTSTAKAAPVTVRTNLVTNPAPSGTTSWFSANLTISDGGGYIRGTAPSTAAGSLRSPTFSVTSGVAYAIKMQLLVSRTQTVRQRLRNDAGALLVDGPNVTATAGVWLNLDAVLTANATVADAAAYPLFVNAQAGDTFDVRYTLVEASPVLGTYFDGSTSAGGDFTYAWTGTAGASTSVQRGVAVAPTIVSHVTNRVVAFQSREWSESGFASMRLSPTDPASRDSYVDILSGTALTDRIQPNVTYTILGTLRINQEIAGLPSGALQNQRLGLFVHLNGTGLINCGATPGAGAPNTVGVYPLRATFTAPSTLAGYNTIRLYSGAILGEAHVWWEDVLIVEGDYDGPYFDGDSIAPLNVYSWSGVVGASTSVETVMRSPITISAEASAIPVKQDYSNVATHIIGQLDDGTVIEHAVTGAPIAYGRVEAWVSLGGILDSTYAEALLESMEVSAATPAKELSITRQASGSLKLPFRDYVSGDTVKYRADGGNWTDGRIVQMTLTCEGPKVTVQETFGSIIRTPEQRLIGMIAGASGGVATGGSGSIPPSIPDVPNPAAPTGFAASPSGYYDENGQPQGKVAFTWNAVTVSVTGAPILIEKYEVLIRDTTLGLTETYEAAAAFENALTLTTGFPVGSAWAAQVVAVSVAGGRSVPSSLASFTIPAPTSGVVAPVAPIVTSGVGMALVVAVWEQDTSPSTAMPEQVSSLGVYASADGSTGWTRVGTAMSDGDEVKFVGTPDEDWWFACTAITSDGQETVRGAAQSITLTGVGIGDLSSQVGTILTGPLIETNPDANLGVKFAAGGIVVYDATSTVTMLVNAATGSVYFKEGLIDGNVIASGTILATAIQAGTALVDLIQSISDQLDLQANSSVQIAVGNGVAPVQSQVDGIDAELGDQRVYFTFDNNGFTVSQPNDPMAFRVGAGTASILANGNVVSYWNESQFVVPFITIDSGRLGNHQLSPDGTDGTVFRAIE